MGFFTRKSQKAGLPPGTLVYTGKHKAAAIRLNLIDYNETEFEERAVIAGETKPYLKKRSVSWFNINGLHDVKLIEKIGKEFGLHPLIMEDIVSTDQRSKLEEYPDILYLVLRMLSFDEKTRRIESEQLSLVLGEGFVLSFQERPGDFFDSVRERIRTGKGRIRRLGSDYLVYSLIDAIVDQYFVILEKFGDEIEVLEEQLIKEPGGSSLSDLHRLKREALSIRRSVWPLRETLSGLQRAEHKMIAPETRPFLRDAYDHTIQVIDTVETYRDMLGGMLDLYLSSVSKRMNEVMKVLTIISTIFIPLTFLTGLYGMNFDNLPELHWRYGYFLLLGAMLLIFAGQLWYFRRKSWL